MDIGYENLQGRAKQLASSAGAERLWSTMKFPKNKCPIRPRHLKDLSKVWNLIESNGVPALYRGVTWGKMSFPHSY